RFLANRRRHIARQVKENAADEQSDFQSKFWVPVIPQTKTNFPRIIVNGEIARMCNEIENPVGENGNAHQKRNGKFTAPYSLRDDRTNCRPNERGNKAVRIRMVIGVEHTACRETFDHSELLDTKQHERCPDVIEKLDCNE